MVRSTHAEIAAKGLHIDQLMPVGKMRQVTTGTMGGRAKLAMKGTSVAQMLGSAGEYAWSGMANTHFLIDPSEDLAMVFMTQFIGLGMEKLSQQLRVLAYQSIVE